MQDTRHTVSPDLGEKSDTLRSSFLNEDSDKDGLINMCELKRALLCTGEILTDEKLQQLFTTTGKQNKNISRDKILILMI